MATPSLIPNHHAAASISLAGQRPVAAAASDGNSGSTITANDFLTLLVTEMQNQDPTAQTDPNEYINQLVQVNSLEQLIQINQTLSGAAGASGSLGGSSPVETGSQAEVHAPASPAAASTQPASAPPSAQAAALTPAPAPIAGPINSGNLSIPASSPAALRVAGALGPRTRY
ncbi:MAG TPA: flagellar hook capping FlgD N-terminal domain-containing protein [Terracidiphilus sp.]|nr:flagellar hook capping FlgD N-terminal domain-containing protein [Terracidiphilus sp.]